MQDKMPRIDEFLQAVKLNQESKVKKLMDENPPIINGKNEWSESALHYAVMHKQHKMVQFLLENGANPCVTDRYGETALDWAITRNASEESVHLLINAQVSKVSNSSESGFATSSHEAAFQGNSANRIKLREQNLHQQDKAGYTPLHYAAARGHKKTVAYLLSQRVPVNEQSKSGRTALLLAARNGHLRVVKQLHAKKADIHLADKDGWTALHLAAFWGHLEIVQTLYDMGADLNVKNTDGLTPLYVAAANGQTSVVETLIEKADSFNTKAIKLDVVDNLNRTALHMAALNGHAQIVKLFCEKEKMLLAKIKNIENNKANQKELEKQLESLKGKMKPGSSQVTQYVNDVRFSMGKVHQYLNSADIQEEVFHLSNELINLKEETCPLHEKVSSYFLTGLLHNQIRNKTSSEGWTTLHFAASEGHVDVVLYLLEQVVDPNASTLLGWTALHLASSKGHLAVVNVLLAQEGIQIDSINKGGWNALHAASSQGHLAVVNVLLAQKDIQINALNYKCGSTALYIAAQNGHASVVDTLIEKRALFNTQNNDGWNALRVALEKGHLAVVNLLLAQKDIQIDAVNKDGKTALYIAAANGQASVVETLIEKRALFNTQANDGGNALHVASSNGHLAVVNVLLAQEGIQINATIRENHWTPLHVAAFHGHLEVVDLLLKHKATKVDALTRLGKTPLSLAIQEGHLKLVPLFKKLSNLKLNNADIGELKTKNKYSQLERLDLSDHAFDEVGADTLAEIVKENPPTLKTLDLSHNSQLGNGGIWPFRSSGVQRILYKLPENKNITALNLSHSALNFHDISSLKGALEKNFALMSLQVWENSSIEILNTLFELNATRVKDGQFPVTVKPSFKGVEEVDEKLASKNNASLPSNAQTENLSEAKASLKTHMLREANLNNSSNSSNKTPAISTVRLYSTEEGACFERFEVLDDGDCGYTSFGIERKAAHQLLKDNINKIQSLLLPVIQEELLKENFIAYLIGHGFADTGLSNLFKAYQTQSQQGCNIESIQNRLFAYAKDLNVINGYIDYDVKDKQIDSGWSHPCVLQALAAMRGIKLMIWLKGRDGQLVPHQQYHEHTPEDATEAKHLLFVNGNHFELLLENDTEKLELGKPVQNESSTSISSKSINLNEKIPVNTYKNSRGNENTRLTYTSSFSSEPREKTFDNESSLEINPQTAIATVVNDETLAIVPNADDIRLEFLKNAYFSDLFNPQSGT